MTTVTRSSILVPVIARRASASILPYTLDFSLFGDGALPFPWLGSSTLTISSGQAVNAPTLSDSVLVNGNMETGDPPSSWTPVGTPTASSVADERTGGAGAASYSIARNGTSNFSIYQAAAAIGAQGWYRLNGWKKRIDSYLRLYYSTGSYDTALVNVGSTWENDVHDGFKTIAGGYVQAACFATVDAQSSLFDDISLKEYTTPAEMFKVIFTGFALVTAKVNITATPQAGALGVVCCVDSPTNPQNYTLALMAGGASASTKRFVQLLKCVGGTKSIVIGVTEVTYAAGASLEIRHTAATTFQVWYNGTQVSTDKTIADAGIISNKYHGIFSGLTGASSGVDAFFCETV